MNTLNRLEALETERDADRRILNGEKAVRLPRLQRESDADIVFITQSARLRSETFKELARVDSLAAEARENLERRSVEISRLVRELSV